jgi:PadR family transcriptional regulator PadR
MENKIKQLRKGILELAILGCLNHESLYGYSLVRSLSGEGDIVLTEGTIYPILGRLAKEGLIQSEWVESSQGPPRKYYSLTQEGEQTFMILNTEFKKLARLVANANNKIAAVTAKSEQKKINVSKEKKDGE